MSAGAMIVVDASVWISNFMLQDVHHGVSRAWLSKTVNGGAAIAVPALLPAEVAGAVARRTGDTELGIRMGEQILPTPGRRLLFVDRELGVLAAKVAAGQRLRGADALCVAAAHRHSIPLVTWDGEQLDRADGLIVAQTPEAPVWA